MNWYTITDSIGSRFVSLVIFRYSELLIRNVYSKHSCTRCKSKDLLTQTRLPSSITLWSSPDARVPIFGAFSGGQGSAWPSCQVVWCSGISNVLSLLTPFYQNPNEPLAIWAKAAHPLDRTARASLVSPGTRMSLDLVCSSPVVPSSDNRLTRNSPQDLQILIWPRSCSQIVHLLPHIFQVPCWRDYQCYSLHLSVANSSST